MNKVFLLSSTLLISFHALADGNTTISSFSKAKKTLERSVYFDHRTTLYCGAKFDAKKNIILPSGFESEKHVKRSKRVEWEHAVPAEKTNDEYRLMQSDMYNLYPAIGSVNAMRSNYNFTMLPGEKSDFGSCDMNIDNKKAEPPENARGRIARSYMYMESAYPRYKMSK
jgi:deoxyribonuclease-1